MNEYLPYLSELLSEALSGIFFILPEIALVIAFLLVIVADLFFPGKSSKNSYGIALTGIIISAVTSYQQSLSVEKGMSLFSGSIVLDKVAISFKLIFAFVTVLFAVFIRGNSSLKKHNKGVGDLYMLLPAVLIGLNMMSMASNLLMVYISIEMVSIASYLMVGYVSGENKQTEASMKYALFGSACSAIMLYGMSLLYGFTGTISLSDGNMIAQLSHIAEPPTALAILLTLVGIGFKLSFVPLHFWSPDVYQGAPTPVTAFLSTAPKIAGFAILIRFLVPFYGYKAATGVQVFDFETTITVIAIVTMILGNFAAIWQNNIKRMLAYSSIAHTGFALMAIVAIYQNGIRSLIFYFTVYALMNMAAFMIADQVEQKAGVDDVRKYKGLGKFLKIEILCFVVILVSLTGLPPTGGFIAKLFIFTSAFEKYQSSGSTWVLSLLITGAITTVVSLFYYFKIPLNAYLRESDRELPVSVPMNFISYVILALTILVLILGLFPSILA
ncbi:NADH-quinone oxidoreductase subunit N [Desertivirga brevis]|uniref:NADH-quinone oxidoreductase subunit N n=1 Tax=Desertivirga brevis TaxID=2810310 RepID=UPI001A95BDFF|nr:NADH-quinone oxidoreductase subunit N [Pedobacter sp. SYSU D00873]